MGGNAPSKGPFLAMAAMAVMLVVLLQKVGLNI
jgi:hypothetical protein